MLTDVACRKSQPKARNYKLTDGRGLYLLVMKTGGKSWRYDYKIAREDGSYKNSTHSFGQYPEISLAEARELHTKAHKMVSEGIDPNAHKKEQRRLEQRKRSYTFKHMADEWLDKRRKEIKAGTIKDIETRLNMDVLPQIGDIPIDQLDALTLLAMIRKIENRGAYEMARRACQYCSQILRYGIALGKTERDFTRDIGDALTSKKTIHQPALSPEEIPEFLEALERNHVRLFPQTRLALKMLMLTFVRPIELATCEWRDIDMQSKVWLVPASKMKMGFDHLVPLSRQVCDILEELKAMNGHRQYVFIKQRCAHEHMSRDTLSKAIRLLGFQGRHTAHGFRAMARTAIREKLDWDSEVIERQLAHAPSNSLGRTYDRAQFIDKRTVMMQGWADYLDKISGSSSVSTSKNKSV